MPLTERAFFTDWEPGCYADGAFGIQHVRDTLAWMLEECGVTDRKLLESLRGEMPDDAWDEYEALSELDARSPEGWGWWLEAGDLMFGPLDMEDPS